MYKVKNPRYKERIKEYLSRQEFMKLAGIQLTSIEPGEIIGEVVLSKEHKQQFGRVHGGLISTLADVTAGFAAYTLVPEDSHVVTGEIKISYFAAAREGSLKAVGKVLKPGRKVSFVESEIYNISDQGQILIAKASTTMVIIPLTQE